MTDHQRSKKWTEKEHQKFVNCVKKHGEFNNWEAVAADLDTGRTPEQCAGRWDWYQRQHFNMASEFSIRSSKKRSPRKSITSKNEPAKPQARETSRPKKKSKNGVARAPVADPPPVPGVPTSDPKHGHNGEVPYPRVSKSTSKSTPTDTKMFCKVELFGKEESIGFIVLPSILKCTFSDARKQIMEDLASDLPAGKAWRFYIRCMDSTLSPKQEEKFGRIIDNLELLGATGELAGSYRAPVTLVVKEFG